MGAVLPNLSYGGVFESAQRLVLFVGIQLQFPCQLATTVYCGAALSWCNMMHITQQSSSLPHMVSRSGD
jgi:hypothetical protein